MRPRRIRRLGFCINATPESTGMPGSRTRKAYLSSLRKTRFALKITQGAGLTGFARGGGSGGGLQATAVPGGVEDGVERGVEKATASGDGERVSEAPAAGPGLSLILSAEVISRRVTPFCTVSSLSGLAEGWLRARDAKAVQMDAICAVDTAHR